MEEGVAGRVGSNQSWKGFDNSSRYVPSSQIVKIVEQKSRKISLGSFVLEIWTNFKNG